MVRRSRSGRLEPRTKIATATPALSPRLGLAYVAAMPSRQLDPALASALEARGYATLTPVQLAVLESAALGRDLLVPARTGSAKTVTYGLVLAESLLGVDGSLG